MGWFSNLFTSGVSEVVEQVGSTIDKFHLSGEEKQNFKLELQQVLMQRESEIEQTIRKNLEAKERILVAELQQGDSYTKRARPSVVYFGLAMIALNYLVVPGIVAMNNGIESLETCGKIQGSGENMVREDCELKTFFPLPEEFWMAWGGIVATWAVGRSFEKTSSSNRFSRAITGNKKRTALLDEDEAVG